MNRLGFPHIFAALLAFAALSAFVLPAHWTDGGRAQVQGLFAPVARPTRSVAAGIYGRMHREPVIDRGTPTNERRPDADILHENEELRQQLSSINTQLDALKELNADRESLGDIRRLCTPVAVMGSDPGARDSLSLTGSTVEGLTVGQPVLHARGIVGRISRAGVSGAQVLLVTDGASKVSAKFSLFRKNEKGETQFSQAPLLPLVEGRGRGRMVIVNITMKQIEEEHIQINDYVVMDDSSWPMNLKGSLLGRVANIAPHAKNALFAEITVDPGTNLEMLREVMVLTKGGG